MSTYTFCIAGDAVPSGRPRVTRTGHVYKPQKSRAYETEAANHIKAQYKQQGGTAPIAEPVKLIIAEYRRIPQRITGYARQEAIAGRVRPDKKPDIDNTVKSIMDALTKAEVWQDDRQVISLQAEKMYAEWPRVEISVEAIS